MTQKRRYYADSWYQKPTNKRNRYHQQPQQRYSQHQHQTRQGTTSVDPANCAREFERLSLSHQNFPPLKSGTQEKLPSTHRSQPPPSTTPSHTISNPSNAVNHQNIRNHQAFPGKSYKFHNGWTEVVKRGNQHSGNRHQMTGSRNPWNPNQPLNNNPPSTSSQPFTRHSSRPIAKLPQRATLQSDNRFAVLGSPPIDQDQLGVPRQSNARMPKLPTKPPGLRRQQNYPLVINDEGYQIDIVLDTNILLAYQHFLRALIPLLGSNCRLLVPAAVLNELDLQKTRQHLVEVFEAGRCSSQQTMGSLARQVTNWLLDLVKLGSSRVVLQKLEEESEEDRRDKDPDTRILTYANNLHLRAKTNHPGTVIALLSNDNMLRLRAQSEGICSVAMADFRHSPRQLVGYIRKIVPDPRNPAISTPSNPSPLNHSHPPEAITPKLNSTIKASQPSSNSCVLSGQDGQFTFTSLLPSTSQQPSGSANRSNQITSEPHLPSAQGRQLIFTSLLPSSSQSSPVGPDQELIRLKFQLQRARPCQSCKSVIETTPPVSPDQIHHYCPMCCEVICKGCMNVTGCDWNCSGPFHGQDCPTIKCCATGRAAIWIELLGQLDTCFLMNQYKISFKHGPKITHLYGDEALVEYMNAANGLLTASGEDDERLGFLGSILISSTLIDVLSQTFLCSPLLSWHFRSELFLSTISVVQGILRKLAQPWKILNSEFVKSSTTGISPLDHRQHKIIWNKISEKDHRPNSTEAKLEKLQDSFPGLMADVEEILHNRPASTSATIRDLLDNAAYVPLCYVLEQLFRLAIEMETGQSDHSVTLPGDIQVTVPLSSDLVRMTSALLDLQIIYESHLSNQTSNTDPNNGTADDQPTERSQRAGRDANKPQGSPVDGPGAKGVGSTVRKSADSSRVTAGNSGEGRSNSKGKNKLDRQETSDEKTNRLDSMIKRANREEGCSRDKTSDESQKKCAGQEKNQKTSSRKANGTRSRSQTDTQGDGEDWDESETGSDSSSSVTKVSDDVDGLSISSHGSESGDDTSDVVILN
ncbi:hexokinase A [Puccinia graminis f. sp. tritici]|uniref:PIN domain-containing protein n=3 Tax=Puccinia graminis f. sp. tritici TaxID=56615 RepID=E3L722_PUCGT|nr:uncharacterized protein PGTG_18332 [Puccinia graminis f. sp. tritici CRL 75-36-700-3]EFP92345.1 hypothetical protein PGTG_18332 [Puccinia graminis f. sp. tritici CRL 75-36-700-3]KAA1138133.1 hexokinase A [Puccinia graminis f. sp. tritici]